jgi:hypothetical protein
MPALYARSDVDYIAIPVERGGCPGGHRRPVNHGARAKLWKLDCQCTATADMLNSDLWSATISEIPETPDETKVREDYEKRGAHDRDYIQAMALAKIAGVEIPDALQRVVTGDPAHVPAITGTMVCQNGHDCEPGSKFCAECGSPMRKPPGLACPEGHPVGARAKFCAECGSPVTVAIEPSAASQPEDAPKVKPLKDWRAADLKALARERGLDDSGTRAEVLGRLRAAA